MVMRGMSIWAGLVVCVIIVAIGLSLAKESILKVIHPSEVDCNVLMIVVLLIPFV